MEKVSGKYVPMESKTTRLAKVPRLSGAYTHKPCFDAIAEACGDPYVPVRTGTCIVRKKPSEGEKLRNKLSS